MNQRTAMPSGGKPLLSQERQKQRSGSEGSPVVMIREQNKSNFKSKPKLGTGR